MGTAKFRMVHSWGGIEWERWDEVRDENVVAVTSTSYAYGTYGGDTEMSR